MASILDLMKQRGNEIPSINQSRNNNIKSIKDNEKRILNFYKTSQGQIFIIKQQGLHLMNPKRPYYLGKDPLKIFNPLKLALSYSGLVNIERHGFTNDGSYSDFYIKENIIMRNNGNRIIRLMKETGRLNKNNEIINPTYFIDTIINKLPSTNNKRLNNIIEKIKHNYSDSVFKELSGIGGVNSIYGVGMTLIHKYNSGLAPSEKSYFNEYYKYTDYLKDNPKGSEIIKLYNNTTNNTTKKQSNKKDILNLWKEFYVKNKQNPGFNIPGLKEDFININDYQYILNLLKNKSYLDKSLELNMFDENTGFQKKIDYFKDIPTYKEKYHYTKDKNYYENWNIAKRLGVFDLKYKSTNNDPYGSHPIGTDVLNVGVYNKSEDLIKIRIGDLQFRAFMSNFQDQYNVNIGSTQYIGRPDPVYHYEGMSRNISLELLLPIFSAKELDVIYEKVNRLLQYASPQISDSGQMGLQVINLKVGMWFAKSSSEGLPVVINSISVNPHSESYWDVIKELPTLIQISLGFNVIDYYSPSHTKKYIRGTSK